MPKRGWLVLIIPLVILLCFAFSSQQGEEVVKEVPEKETLRVGTFDSRAIAHAYGLSEIAKPMVSDMRKKYDLAKKEGNEELRIELKALHQVMQQQAFSVACVADILEKDLRWT